MINQDNNQTVEDELLDEPCPIRVLLVEHDASDAKRFMNALEASGSQDRCVVVSSYDAAIEMVQDQSFHVLVAELNLPEYQGLETIKAFRGACPEVPFIILSETDDEETARLSIDLGAQDYLIKPIREYVEVRRRMLYAIRRHALNKADQKLMRQLQASSQIDTLTGLNNRAAMARESERQLAIAIRKGTPLSMGMIDIDFFKAINDRYGHQAGDDVLVEIANRFNRAFRASDIACRFGGEEFCVILPETDEEAAFGWGCRIAEAVRAEPFQTRQGPIPVTISIGTATLFPNESINDCLGRADHACQVAKNRGRDQVVAANVDQLKRSADEENSRKSSFSILDKLVASDVMSSIVVSATETTAIDDVAQLMLECRCEAIPVLKENGELKGLLTTDDIVSHVLQGGNWKESVGEIAGQGITFSADTQFGQIWSLFQRLPIRRAIVMCEDRPIGIVNRGQLLRILASYSESVPATQTTVRSAGNAPRLFEEVKRIAEKQLNLEKDEHNPAGDFATLIAATQIQEIASQLLQESSKPSGCSFLGHATATATAMIDV